MSGRELIVGGKPLSSLRVVDLKVELDKVGLSKSGTKKDLADRLKNHLLKSGQVPEAPPAPVPLSGEEEQLPNIAIQDKLPDDNPFIREYFASQAQLFHTQSVAKKLYQEEAKRESEGSGTSADEREKSPVKSTPAAATAPTTPSPSKGRPSRHLNHRSSNDKEKESLPGVVPEQVPAPTPVPAMKLKAETEKPPTELEPEPIAVSLIVHNRKKDKDEKLVVSVTTSPVKESKSDFKVEPEAKEKERSPLKKAKAEAVSPSKDQVKDKIEPTEKAEPEPALPQKPTKLENSTPEPEKPAIVEQESKKFKEIPPVVVDTKPIEPMVQVKVPEPETPMVQEKIPEPEKQMEQEKIPEPEEPVEKKKIPEPEKPMEQEKIPEPEKPMEQEKIPEPEKPMEQEKIPEPAKPKEEASVPDKQNKKVKEPESTAVPEPKSEKKEEEKKEPAATDPTPTSEVNSKSTKPVKFTDSYYQGDESQEELVLDYGAEIDDELAPKPKQEEVAAAVAKKPITVQDEESQSGAESDDEDQESRTSSSSSSPSSSEAQEQEPEEGEAEDSAAPSPIPESIPTPPPKSKDQVEREPEKLKTPEKRQRHPEIRAPSPSPPPLKVKKTEEKMEIDQTKAAASSSGQSQVLEELDYGDDDVSEVASKRLISTAKPNKTQITPIVFDLDLSEYKFEFEKRKMNLKPNKFTQRRIERREQDKKDRAEKEKHRRHDFDECMITSKSLEQWFPDTVLLTEEELNMEETPSQDQPLSITRTISNELSPLAALGLVEADDTEEMDLTIQRKISLVPPLMEEEIKLDSVKEISPPSTSTHRERERDRDRPRHPPSPLILVTNLVRPFTLAQLKELLQRTGVVVDLWVDKIKSKCVVKYDTEEEATETRIALHGLTWPNSNPKSLHVDYTTDKLLEDLKRKDGGTGDVKITSTDDTTGNNRSKQDEHRVREWDVGKSTRTRSRSPGGGRNNHSSSTNNIKRSSRDRSRSRDHKRSRRTPSPSSHRDRDHRRRSRSVSPHHDRKGRGDESTIKKPESSGKSLDEIFRKTTAAPCIYWLPLNPQQIAEKAEALRKRMEERERRIAEAMKLREHERGDRGVRDRRSPLLSQHR